MRATKLARAQYPDGTQLYTQATLKIAVRKVGKAPM